MMQGTISVNILDSTWITPCVVTDTDSTTPSSSTGTKNSAVPTTPSSEDQALSESDPSRANKIAIGVGLGVGIPTIFIGLLSWWFPRRRKARNP
jgi:hypothetical protein